MNVPPSLPSPRGWLRCARKLEPALVDTGVVSHSAGAVAANVARFALDVCLCAPAPTRASIQRTVPPPLQHHTTSHHARGSVTGCAVGPFRSHSCAPCPLWCLCVSTCVVSSHSGISSTVKWLSVCVFRSLRSFSSAGTAASRTLPLAVTRPTCPQKLHGTTAFLRPAPL